MQPFRPELMTERAQLYADPMHQEGAPLGNCVGFIDSTKLQTSRPGGNGCLQRACYSGH